MEIKTKHLFKIVTISNKVGFTKNIKVLITGLNLKGLTKEQVEEKQQELTADMVVHVIENIDKAEKEIYELLADLAGKTTDEIENQSVMDTINSIKEIFQSEEVLDFLSQTAA